MKSLNQMRPYVACAVTLFVITQAIGFFMFYYVSLPAHMYIPPWYEIVGVGGGGVALVMVCVAIMLWGVRGA